MEVQFTPEQEAKLTQIAAKAGTDAQHLVKDVALRLLAGDASFQPIRSALPVWHLGGTGSLHRRDIYNDVR